MRSRRPALVALLVAGALVVPGPPAAGQSATAFGGRYRLTLTFASTCVVAVRSVSLLLDLGESAVARGSEIEGRPAIPAEAQDGAITLLRISGTVHGGFATQGGLADRNALSTLEGHLVIPWLMFDGTVATGGARPSARGTAFGVLQVGRESDEYPDTLGSCSATRHEWALDPA